jgi:hypothetical protein
MCMPHTICHTMAQASLRSSSTGNTLTYGYTPLANPSQTRLLRLMPGKWDDPINCVIEPVDLDEKPTYKALSYTWGDPDRKTSILIGESHLIVTDVARSRQVYMKWSWKHCLLSIYSTWVPS